MQSKQTIGSLFDRIARQYDRFNHLTSFGMDVYWRKSAIRRMAPAEHVLDVAVGTADLSLEMLRRDKAKRITGIDLSDEMMKIGQHKAIKAGLSDRIVFSNVNAQQMPFADGSFDAVTCSYGIRNFSDLEAGLHEFQRVLRPGGQLLILEFSYPSNPVIAFFYTIYFRYVMTTIGSLLTGKRSDFNYFFHSVRTFIWGDAMRAKLSEAGFSDITYDTYTFGVSTLYLATKK